MLKSIIVAKAENDVIGRNNKIPWHMPADLKHFKHKTLGHAIIMGRKTFESLKKPLPGRTTIIVTTNQHYQVPRCTVVHEIVEAFQVAQQAGETEVFIAGGGEIYRKTLPFADKIYLTIIRTKVEGCTFFPVIDNNIWTVIKRESYAPDEKNPYPYDFMELERIKK
ncbi:MAG: dihydrofolate reductase [Cytophagales bacterium]|nr:dihydrofolate reductase [Cytophagales bacterium]